MPYKKLEPIRDRESYSRPIAEQLEHYFHDLIYRPLLEIMQEETGLTGVKLNAGEIAKIAFKELIPCPYNRQIDREKVIAIKRDILATGEIKPFVIVEVATDDGAAWMITDGHHRQIAIQELTSEGRMVENPIVPCVVSGEEGTRSARNFSARKINTKNNAIIALQTGKIQYLDGCFVGQMNATLGKYFNKIGGRFNHVRKGWKVSLDQMPMDLKKAVLDGRTKSREMEAKLRKKLDEIKQQADSITRPLSPSEQVGKILDGLQEQFNRTTSETITIKPHLSTPVKKAIEQDYTTNLDKYIKEWQDEAIIRLRQRIEANTMEGFRSDRMVESIMAEDGVSRRKAEFLARQETSLLVSKYRQASYQEVGLNEYEWSTSHDARVRHDHRELNGRIFRFDNPPITDQATGARNNPGEDYNCRCVAIPIFRESWETALSGKK